MKFKRKYKRLFSVVAVLVVSVVLLLCSSVSAFAVSSSDFITYKGKQFSSFKFVESITYEYGSKYTIKENVTIPNTYNAQGNTKGQPFYADVRLASLKSDTLVLQPGQSIYFRFRYWCNVVLSTTPDDWTFYYPGSDVQIYYAVNDSPYTLNYTATVDTSYTASDTLPYVLDVTFTNNSGSAMEFYGVRFGDIDGDNTWPGGLKRDTLKGYFNVNQFYYRIMTAEELANDELLHGWKPKPEKPSGQDKVDATGKLEQQIGDNAQSGIDDANEVFDDFAGTLDLLYPGMIFITGLFNDILGEVSILRSLLIISLTLGVIGFILNLFPSVGSRLHRADVDKQREKDRAERQKYREEQRARREKNYKSKRK